MKETELRAYVGNMQQVAYVRRVRFEEGRASGMKAVEVKNGPLNFTAMEDKALDIAKLEYKGVTLNFLSKPGLNGRNHFDTNGEEALRSIMGGLFFTCGFENICGPYTSKNGNSYPMHGRLRTTPAEHVGTDAQWINGKYVVSVKGEMREAELFGENLILRRTISTTLGETRIRIDDTAINEGFRSEPAMWMYHCNFGWPFLAPGSQIIIPALETVPRDDVTASDEHDWSTVAEPIAGKPESVFIHQLAADTAGRTFAAIVNDELSIAVSLEFSLKEFPYFMEWKSMGSGDYVVGLEPSNSSVYGRGLHEKNNDLHTIAPQDQEHKTLEFVIHEGRQALNQLMHRRDILLKKP